MFGQQRMRSVYHPEMFHDILKTLVTATKTSPGEENMYPLSECWWEESHIVFLVASQKKWRIKITELWCFPPWQDYSWEDHGFSLVNRLYPDFGQLLDEKFQIAYNLTYNTMATHQGVDTSMLRRAIWNYIHCMFGIRYVSPLFN